MEFQETAIVPIVIALVEAAKQVGLNNRFAPVLSIILGIGLGLLAGGVSLSSASKGLVFGLAASGLYAGSKTILK